MRRCGAAVLGAGAGLAGPWAMGCLVLAAHATVHVAGPSAALGLPLAATAALLAVLCRPAAECSHGHGGELLVLMSSWAQLLAHGAALAACARTLSITMGYVSGGQFGGWILRQVGLPINMFAPDLLAVTITLVPSVLFALGLEQSPALRLLLNVSVGGSVVFLTSAGIVHADMDSWHRSDLLAVSSSKVLVGAAMCSYGFLGFATVAARRRTNSGKERCKTVAAVTFICLLSYCTVAMVLVVMVHYSSLVGSDVPLVKVFEVRDVDWARLVMAAFTILCLGLTLLEISTPLHLLVVSLAGEEWRVLPRALSKESSTLGTPVLAIMSCGCVLGLLAGVCPVDPLLRVMCTAPLLEQAIRSAETIHKAYQPLAGSKTVRYSRLGKVWNEGDDTDDEEEERHRAERRQQATVGCLKSGLAFLPSAVRRQVPRAATSRTNSDGRRQSVASRDSGSTVITSVSCEHVLDQSASVDSNLPWNGGMGPAAELADNVPPTTIANGCIKTPDVTSNSHVSRNVPNISFRTINGHCMNGANRGILMTGQQESCCDIRNNEIRNCGLEGSFHKDVSSTGTCNPHCESDAEHAEGRRNSYGSTECSEEEAWDGAEDSTSSSSMADEGSRSSTTDIDAAVAEYKEQLKVVATRAEPQPTSSSSRVVAAALCGVLACATLLGMAAQSGGVAAAWCAGAGAAGLLVLLVVIAVQPRAQSLGRSRLVPWLPAAGLTLNVVLFCQLVITVWPAVLGWMLAGCMLYWWRRGSSSLLRWTSCRSRRRYSCREQIRLQVPPRQSTVPRLIPSHQHLSLPGERTHRLTRVDTILIAR